MYCGISINFVVHFLEKRTVVLGKCEQTVIEQTCEKPEVVLSLTIKVVPDNALIMWTQPFSSFVRI